MPKGKRAMMFVSKLPSLVGTLQTKNNRTYTQQELADMIGIRRQTINKWMSSEEIKGLDPDTAHAIMKFFSVGLSDIVDIIQRPQNDAAA